jgi:hypothetical protein
VQGFPANPCRTLQACAAVAFNPAWHVLGEISHVLWAMSDIFQEKTVFFPYFSVSLREISVELK